MSDTTPAQTDAADSLSKPQGRSKMLWLWLSLSVVVVDQFTKWAIVDRFVLYERIEINALLNVTRLHNYGAAFSFLGDQGGWQRWLFVVLSIVVTAIILVWLRRLPRAGHHWLAAALACIVGGAIGNVIDRVQYGYVVDFIQVHWQDAYFPTFNVADIAISVGAFLLIVDSFLGSGRASDA
ncbi:MAG: signal peptidase II [Pseudomonadota bacterium]